MDTAGLERALGAIATTFRLARLYPPTPPAVVESMHQVTAALPGLAELGPVEWRITATGLQWQGQQLLAGDAQVAELAGLLYARGIRGMHVDPGLSGDHVLALFGVALGMLPPDDARLGSFTLTVGGRSSQRPAAARGDRPRGLGAHGPGDRATHGGAAGGAARAPRRARVVGGRRGGARRGVGPARDRRVPRHAGRPADPVSGGHAPGG